MAEVRLTGVNKYYGSAKALHDVTLSIGDGEFAVFVGPSGCGKSTLLRSIAGLEEISDGSITIGGRDVTLTRHPNATWRWFSSPTRSIRT